MSDPSNSAPKLPLKQRIVLWFVERRLKKELLMLPKPLPKWVGWLSMLAGLFSAGGALYGVVPPKYAAVVAGVTTVISNVTHSLNGTGGAPAK